MKATTVMATIFLALALTSATHAQAQSPTSCVGHTVSTPCLQLNLSNAAMAATQANNSSGVEISGPGTATVWKCVGSASICSITNLGKSPWVGLPSIPQASAAAVYADWSVSYNTTYNYAVTNSWTGGGTSGYSSVLTFQSPQASQAAPVSPATPTGTFLN